MALGTRRVLMHNRFREASIVSLIATHRSDIDMHMRKYWSLATIFYMTSDSLVRLMIP